MTTTPRLRNRMNRRGGFTLIEILVAVLLLSISMAAIVTLWSVSRKITERSRDTGEYYAIARQELERARAFGFNGFPAGVVTTPSVTVARYYDASGNNVSATPASGIYWAESTYSLVATNATPEAPGEKLGVQVVVIYGMSNSTKGAELYRTTMFFTSAGV